jgi:hypothetical protein
MPWSVVQHKQAGGTTAAQSSLATTLASPLTAGNTVAVLVSMGQVPPAAGVTDNQGNTYTRRQLGSAADSTSARVAIYTAYNVASNGGACTITLTPSGTAFMLFDAVELSPGVAGGSVSVDVSGGGGSGTATTSPATASVTSTTTNGIALAAMSNLSNINQPYTTTAAGWTQLDADGNGSSDQTGAFSYRLLGAAGAQACTWSTGTDAGGYDACIVVLTVTGGGGGGGFSPKERRARNGYGTRAGARTGGP